MILDLTHNNNNWIAKFDSDLNIEWVMYNGEDVSERIIGSELEMIVWESFDMKYNLDHAQYCLINNYD
jgi:hypothetical protein